MKSAKDPMLESDHLDELLEVPPPAQPVVVVQYRNRGVPSWVFVPLLFVVPLGAIVVYHRMVVERYRVQAAQADSLLETKISDERARQPIVRNDPPPTTILPGSKAAVSPSDGDPFETLLDPPPATTVIEGSESVKKPAPTTASAGPETPAAGAPNQPAPAENLVVTEAVRPAAPPEVPPAPPEKTTKITVRSVLANPFADGNDPPPPPTPGAGVGSAATPDKQVKGPAGQTQDLVDRSAQGEPGGRAPQAPADKAPVGGAQVAMGPAATAAPLQPLPTKEESERQIQEEAAQRAADLAAQAENKIADARAQRHEEQRKFHEELRELIAARGDKAGPDIDALAKRYGFEFDPERYARAHHIWNSRNTQGQKIKLIRALELPETVILNFLSDDIYKALMVRNGLRNQSEVRVKAAQQLLKFPLPKSGAARRPAVNAGSGAPAARTSSPSRKSVVSSPR